tara:strand:- start:744 stop:1145 length:402 start_codon:yes stop_codon:yes gene_type:complete
MPRIRGKSRNIRKGIGVSHGGEDFSKLKLMFINYSLYMRDKDSSVTINDKDIQNVQMAFRNVPNPGIMTHMTKSTLVRALKSGSVSSIEQELNRMNLLSRARQIQKDTNHQTRKLLPWWMIIILVVCLIILYN